MKIQSDQQVYTIHYGLRVFWNEVYEAYFMQAAFQYSQENVPRTFSLNKGREKIVLNERVYDEKSGELVGIRNDVSKLMEIRHKVIIADKIASPTEKIDQLDAIGKFLQNLGGSSPLVTKYLVHKATELMQPFDDDEKDAIGMLSELDMQNAISATMLQTLQSKASVLQWQEQIREIEKTTQQKRAQEAAAAQGLTPPGAQQVGPPQIGAQPQGQGQPQPQEVPPAVQPFRNPTQESPVQIQPQPPAQPEVVPQQIAPQGQGVPT
jgi:hypothetical protein